MLPTDDQLSGLTEVRNPVSSSTLKRPPHLKALTSVRALAALYVGFYHMVRPFGLWGRFTGFWGAGYSAVSFFFFLSGFILVYTHGVEFASGKGDTKRFLVARFARVYPLYLLVTIVAGIGAHSVLFHPAYHVIAYVAQVFMLQSWHIRLTPFFNIVAWSLSEEAFFYCCFPFVAAHLQPRSLRRGVLLLLGLCVLALVPGLIAMQVEPIAAWHEVAATTGSHHMLYFVRRFPPLMLPQFLCGIVAGWIYLQRPVSDGFAKLALLCGGTVLFSALLLANHLPFILLHNGLLIPCYVLILYGLARPNIVSKVLSWAPFVLAGEASYAFYLTHFMFNDWAASVLHWPMTIAGLLPRLAVLLPLSLVLHLYVERPGRRWVMKWWDARVARLQAMHP
jgi:peptidoglycan/LPS O-acetylase OafA/YrhL